MTTDKQNHTLRFSARETCRASGWENQWGQPKAMANKWPLIFKDTHTKGESRVFRFPPGANAGPLVHL